MEADALREYLRIACNALGYDHAEAWNALPERLGARSGSLAGNGPDLESGQRERIPSQRLPLRAPCLATEWSDHPRHRGPSARPRESCFAAQTGRGLTQTARLS